MSSSLVSLSIATFNVISIETVLGSLQSTGVDDPHCFSRHGVLLFYDWNTKRMLKNKEIISMHV